MEDVRGKSLKRAWAARLPASRAGHAAALRLLADVQVCQSAEQIWLRGGDFDERLDQRLAAIPGAERFLVLPDEQLVPRGQRVPRGSLPGGPWAPLSQWLAVQLPRASWGGQVCGGVPLRLVRSAAPAEPNLLLTSIDRWVEYAAGAPQLRLARWRFAARSDARVAIWGEPVPPLPGQRGLVSAGVAVPLGCTWSPPVEADVVKRLFELEEGDVALFIGDGHWERIPADQFVRATRTAVRMTAGELPHG